MERVLEPEIMGDPEQAEAYAAADFSASNQWFVDHVAALPADRLREVVDLGSGPCDVVVRLARALPAVAITAVDGSAAMLAIGRRAVAAAGLAARVSLLEAYVPGVRLADHRYDAVLSKDFLHHLPDPMALWHEAKRLARPGALVCVMDLIRPATPAAARAIVARVAPDAHPILQADFYNSLCAAFTIDEIAAQLAAADLALAITAVSERHMLIEGRA
jgi:ubiquinone/menaquinone biosynthesis C-methylase UbiE